MSCQDFLYLCYLIIFNRSGNIEKKNNEPKPNSYQSFPICQWNLNSIFAHNLLKLSLLEAYISGHSFDVIYLSETYLNLFILHDDDNLQIPGYNLYSQDYPLNIIPEKVFPKMCFSEKGL